MYFIENHRTRQFAGAIIRTGKSFIVEIRFNAARGNLLVQWCSDGSSISSVTSFNAARGNSPVQFQMMSPTAHVKVFQCRTRQSAGAIRSAAAGREFLVVSMPHAAICWCNIKSRSGSARIGRFQCRTRQFAGAIPGKCTENGEG